MNAGTSWTKLSSGTTKELYSIEFSSAQTGYACGRGFEIIKTTNGGADWEKINHGKPAPGDEALLALSA
ncbi:MAG TPA: hypothetical protein VK872_13460, partial [Draconibacterium sp.]|nr:hypothetical protein [Draconibacterium sp.]